MIATLRRTRLLLLGAVAALLATAAQAQQVTYETGPDGVRYQVTRTTVNRTVPVTENLSQTQTTYRQQVVTQNQQYQQVYRVPVTQYQLVTRLHGRWNPFITPYYTHEYQPVTTYQNQVATVNMPVTSVSWAPETRTVQTPVTRYAVKPVEVTERVAVGNAPAARPLMAANSAPATAAGPSATVAARPSAPATTYGGRAMTSDPPRQASGWQPQAGSRYQ